MVPARFLAAIALPLAVTSSMPERTNGAVERLEAATPVAGLLRVFVSGHSLTDHPFPDYLSAIGGGEARAEWNMQHLFGSSIRDRSKGQAGDGFRSGVDRYGQRIDVLREFETAVPAYDTLVLAERHTLLDSLVWEDTIGSVLDYEARFHLASPGGRAFLLSSWLDLDQRDDPSRWIHYEQRAAGAWRCTASQINRSLASQGAERRVTLIPVAEGLAALVAAGVSGGLPPFRNGDASGIVETLFADQVHLTPAGSYYAALLAYGVMHRELPPQIPVPGEIESRVGQALQHFARGFLDGLSRSGVERSEAQCRAYVAGFVPLYLAYVRDVRWRGGPLKRTLQWARLRVTWPLLFGLRSSANPLRVRP
ncbi:MAG: hypothetical protein J7500_14390 [Sphingomonas sp.]|uniref:hypothetical protein n=1 Tax=Sphingomonas sp. TaxID=28214 RepID=UPI001B0C28D3|nr:hypothetical protein [Sphingomonas sp.]MBO9623894.1 hypothetical protein [Sphingomonas sp.]